MSVLALLERECQIYKPPAEIFQGFHADLSGSASCKSGPDYDILKAEEDQKVPV